MILYPRSIAQAFRSIAYGLLVAICKPIDRTLSDLTDDESDQW